MITYHQQEVVELGFRGTEVELRRADAACRSTRPADDVTLVSTCTAHDDMALYRRRSANSLTSCTSSECVVPPTQ